MEEKNFVYVATYKSETYENASLFDLKHFVLSVFAEKDKAQKYAEEYFNNDCGSTATIEIKRNKRDNLSIKVSDVANVSENSMEYRTLKIETIPLNAGRSVVEDIQEIMLG